jgi:lipopolysaccharide/colanic/teichoic acid biosynthesis glycosyltransferase
MNRLIALILLILFIPLILILGLLIFFFIDKEIFFTQQRISLNKKFKCYKFATLKYNKLNECNKPSHLETHRINYLGRIIREFFLDEILQLINIIKGDINFFGPRPLPVYEDLEYQKKIIFWNKRNLIKAGLTCLAQCKGYAGSIKNISQLKKRHAYDVLYIKIIKKKNIISIYRINLFILTNTLLLFLR